MEIEERIAEKIIARTKGLIPYDINVMNKQGIVVASTDATRMGLAHSGASWVIEHQATMIVEHADTRYLAGAKPGVNLPIAYQGHCIGVVGITGDPEQVCELGALLKMTAELLVEHSREKDAALLLSIEKENCLKQVVTGQLNSTQAQAALKKVHLSRRFPARCVIFQPKNTLLDYQQKLALTPVLALAVKGWFFFSQESGLTVVLDAKDDKEANLGEIAAVLPPQLTIGVGASVNSIEELALSYASATAAITFGQATATDFNATVYCYESHKEKIIISSQVSGWRKDELTKEYRALVNQDPHGTLRLTLRTLISSSVDMSTCAHRLNIHRNTLRNRLDKIEQITGVDYKKLDQLFRLYLGNIMLDE
ncbi:MAG: CdaR family transcriptional regulator [Oceanisphaera sp.]